MKKRHKEEEMEAMKRHKKDSGEKCMEGNNWPGDVEMKGKIKIEERDRDKKMRK